MKDHLKAAADSLRAKGVRMTPQRLAVIEYLFSAPPHFTASQVFSAVSKTLRSLSLSTVYDTLQMLRQHEIVETVCPTCGESHFQVKGDRHSHVVCSKCSRLEDLPAEPISLPPEYLSKASRASGFSIARAEIVFVGLCPACQ